MEEGTTSIDDLLKSGGSVSDESMVDSILEEINATKGQQVQKKNVGSRNYAETGTSTSSSTS